jgi:hypothetical protein
MRSCHGHVAAQVIHPNHLGIAVVGFAACEKEDVSFHSLRARDAGGQA